MLYNDRDVIWGNFPILLDNVYDLLPSPKLKPIEVEPGKSAVLVGATENRGLVATDVPINAQGTDLQEQGFNDLIIAVPVRFKKVEGYFAYAWPTTDSLSVAAGQVVHGLPRVLAEITFSEEDTMRACHLRMDGQDVLTLRVRRVPTQMQTREMIYFGVKERHVLKTVSWSQGQFGSSSQRGDATLTWGNHPLATQLRDLNLDDVSVSSVIGKVRSKVYRGVDAGVL
jgi:hypothetical protein